jgi:hypothetical protein
LTISVPDGEADTFGLNAQPGVAIATVAITAVASSLIRGQIIYRAPSRIKWEKARSAFSHLPFSSLVESSSRRMKSRRYTEA